MEAAHEKGIVHRDLKPANVKIAADGRVKVLDFGLARAVSGASGPAAIADSPTLSLAATHAGVILGTAPYMSPEQAKGSEVDARSDLFSFGCVLYEMLTAHRPFDGDTAVEALASVLVRDADLRALPPRLNPRLHDLLERCLQKDRKRRWQAAGDLRAELEIIAKAPRAADPPSTASASTFSLTRAIVLVATALVFSALGGAAAWMIKPAATVPISRFSIVLGEGQNFTRSRSQVLAISPDGSLVVYVANRQLYSTSAPPSFRPTDAGSGSIPLKMAPSRRSRCRAADPSRCVPAALARSRTE
jgi:serine/threonine-protein kinase